MKERRRRSLTAEERALWDKVARSADALRPDEAPPAEGAALSADAVSVPDGADVPPPARPAAAAGARAAPPSAAAVKQPPRPPALTPIDRRTRGRLARGSIALDGRLDLHGMTQIEAHDRLAGFLRATQAGGGRLVLVITGKGRPGDTPLSFLPGESGRGTLRRTVPNWLVSAEFRPLVAGFEAAHRTHGGDGALYVRLRRRFGRSR